MHRPYVITGTLNTGVLAGCPQVSATATPNRTTRGRGPVRPASALGALGRRLLAGLGPPVPAHVSVLVHIGLDQVAHLHGVDLSALAVAYLGAWGRGTNDPDVHGVPITRHTARHTSPRWVRLPRQLGTCGQRATDQALMPWA